MLLAIDTSTRYGGVMVWGPEGPVGSHTWFSRYNHTAVLAPTVVRLLDEEGIKMTMLTGLALALGPGGFSALRVGMSLAKGLVLALNIPLVGISTLETEAYPYSQNPGPICPVLEAGREDVAWAWFEGGQDTWRKTRDEEVVPFQQLIEETPQGATLCGELLMSRGTELKEALEGRANILEYQGQAPRLAALAKLGAWKLAEGAHDDPAALQPLYLRRPSITKANPPTRIRY
jgi:tRNA threonylcarbamoyladenosine biosynthesis protein TsaB